jgi:hypothetical protein
MIHENQKQPPPPKLTLTPEEIRILTAFGTAHNNPLYAEVLSVIDLSKEQSVYEVSQLELTDEKAHYMRGRLSMLIDLKAALQEVTRRGQQFVGIDTAKINVESPADGSD